MNYRLIREREENEDALDVVLKNRGLLNEDDMAAYICANKDNIIPPAGKIKNLEKGVMMLLKHIKNNDRLYFIVDPDMDGFCACALFLNYLDKYIPSYKNYSYNFHPDKTHGIDLDLVDKEAKMVIALDSSSNDYEIHKSLYEKGIDVLVIDHHQSKKESEYACVINNQLCDYPTKSLSGAAMVFKFFQYFDEVIDDDLSSGLIDIAAASIISDMMNLKDLETRTIVKIGLSKLNNPLLVEMVQKNAYQIGDEITPTGIAFYVAPYINAVTRVGTQEEKRIVFDAMLVHKAYSLIPSTKRGCKGQFETVVAQALRVCTNAKNHQNKEKEYGIEKLENLMECDGSLNHKVIVAISDTSIRPTIRGLIANNLMSKYQKPCAVLSRIHRDGQYFYEGSARGFRNCDLTDFRQFCNDTGLINYAEGHKQAFGLSIPAGNLHKFILKADTMLKDIDFTPTYLVDLINCSYYDVLHLAHSSDLWGEGMPEPYVAMENVRITKDNLALMSKDKNPTLKITLDNGVSCIKFKSSEEEYNRLYSDSGCVIVTLIGRCTSNEWMGKVTPQILIDDYEIITTEEYYF